GASSELKQTVLANETAPSGSRDDGIVAEPHLDAAGRDDVNAFRRRAELAERLVLLEGDRLEHRRQDAKLVGRDVGEDVSVHEQADARFDLLDANGLRHRV